MPDGSPELLFSNPSENSAIGLKDLKRIYHTCIRGDNRMSLYSDTNQGQHVRVIRDTEKDNKTRVKVKNNRPIVIEPA